MSDTNNIIKIKLSDGTIFDHHEGKTILESAQISNVNLEYSCTSGRCNACKARVLSGDSKIIKSELINDKDLKNNDHILTCCREPTTDILLDLKNLKIFENFKAFRKPSKVYELDYIGEYLLRLSLRINPADSFKFLPGQYIKLRYKNVERSYSIAGYDEEKKIISLVIRKYPEGKMSNLLFQNLSINELMHINGPFGTFHYDYENHKDIVFLATGTGIAPFMSMLADMNKKRIKNKIVLLWGNRYETDFFKLLEYDQLNLNFLKVLSRENKSGYEKGYVQNIMFEKITNLQEMIIYGCGSEDMIKDTEKKLAGMLPPPVFYKDIFVES